MTPEIIGSLLGFVVAIIAGAIGYGRLQNKLDGAADDNKNQWKIISELRAWITSHERDSYNVRRELEKEISSVREMVLKNDGRWEEVIRRFDALDAKIDKLETREEKRT